MHIIELLSSNDDTDEINYSNRLISSALFRAN